MKNTILLFVLLFSHIYASPEKPSDITYEWLIDAEDGDGGSSYVVYLNEVFQKTKVRACLEFGVGYGTKMLLDNCNKVLSVEVVTHGYGPGRIKQFISFYRDYSNWIPISYFSGYYGDMSWAPYKYTGSDAVYKACSYQCATACDYSLIDPFYQKELGEFIGNIVKYNKVDMALVHPILFLRGDLVQLLFDKVPIIIAHNTELLIKGENPDFWGFTRVKTPEEYEMISTLGRTGTTIWVKKKPEYQELIQKLKNVP